MKKILQKLMAFVVLGYMLVPQPHANKLDIELNLPNKVAMQTSYSIPSGYTLLTEKTAIDIQGVGYIEFSFTIPTAKSGTMVANINMQNFNEDRIMFAVYTSTNAYVGGDDFYRYEVASNNSYYSTNDYPISVSSGTYKFRLFQNFDDLVATFKKISFYTKLTNADTTAPTITVNSGGGYTFYVDVNKAININTLLATISAFDEGDNAVRPVTLYEDNCSGTFTIVGTCTFKVRATDTSGNTANATMTVYKQSLVPTISTTTSQIEVSYSVLLTDAQIKQYFVAKNYNNIDISGSININTTNYKNNFNKVGQTIDVVGTISDSGYSAQTTLKIKITDIDLPYFLITDNVSMVVVSPTQCLGVIDFLKIAMGQNDVAIKSYAMVTDDYTANFNTYGEYGYEAVYTTADDLILTQQLIVKVSDLSLAEKENKLVSFYDSYKYYIFGGAGAIVLILMILKRRGK